MKNFYLITLGVFYSLTSFAGQLLVVGESGPSQLFSRVYAYRCQGESRGSCGQQSPTVFGLNQKTDLVDGQYLIGFENSVNPELVQVQSGQVSEIRLVKLMAPATLKKSTSILVSRNFANSKELDKYFWTLHLMKKPMFRLSIFNGSGYYLSGATQREVVQRLTYEYCEKTEKIISGYSDDAKKICEAWNSQQISRLSEIIGYNSETQGLIEQWVTHPGDRVRVDHLRHLVSAPIKGSEFVSVFPGSYRFTVDKETVVVQATGSGQ